MADSERSFVELSDRARHSAKHVCVGLDTDPRILRKLLDGGLKLPTRAHATMAETVVAYNQMVVDVTRDVAAAYKPNLAFYKLLGNQGMWAVKRTLMIVQELAPDSIRIVDGKYGDIGSTNEGHVYEAFDYLRADAATVHNYMGSEAMRPFLERVNKGTLVLARTSNPGGGEFQDLVVAREGHRGRRLYEDVAIMVRERWNIHGNCGVVAGATFPEEARGIRDIVGPDMFILIPGVGAQGQKASEIVPVALEEENAGVVNSSRAMIFPKVKEGERIEDAILRAARDLEFEIVSAQNGRGIL